MEKQRPWSDSRVRGFLDNATFLISRDYATPWNDFDSISEQYKYPVVIYAAIEYWWAKAGEYASKFDLQTGSGANQKSTQLFYRALELIDYLKKELEEATKNMLDEDSSGDVIIGDLVRRSKFTGYLIPRAADPAGDWTS